METSTFYQHLDKNKLENIRGGMFKNNSYSGYSSQVLKSGIWGVYKNEIKD